MNDTLNTIRMEEERLALERLFALVEQAPAPYEDRDEIIPNAFQELTERERIAVLRALMGRM